MAVVNIDAISSMLHEVFKDPEALKRILQTLVNIGMREEVAAHLGADEHERTEDRRGHRNGNKPRKLASRVGQLELSVPQVRGCEPYHPSMFARWQRSERALLVACSEMYFQGVSTRNVQSVLTQMCDLEISSTTVSRVASELDEKLSGFVSRRLDHSGWEYLMLDARYEKVRVDGKVISQAVLVTVGFTVEGRREVLDWRVADSESQDNWGDVFASLKDRGLGPVKLVISDAHRGIRSAVSRHLQGAAWQRCRVHFKREMGRRVSYKKLKELNQDLVAVFAVEQKDQCLLRAQQMADKWQKSCPAVATMLRDGLEDCLTANSFPEHHRKRLRSTNLLENIMKQLKKRTRVVGVFPNRASCHRLIGSQLLELHERWQTDTAAYFNMIQYAAA
ncbi:MAG TPA: IS256 family transposase [Humisphaera sp.]|jgi:transposase-like protein|nr:IS256 family transposase [Humisphaera sp.]